MFYCKKCGCSFEAPHTSYESHGLKNPPYEKSLVCPSCKGTDFYERVSTHCRCCGAQLKKGQKEYCSQKCSERGKKLWESQAKHKNYAELDPINIIIRELMEYNRRKGTDYSYGQYVALKAMRGKKKKCGKKRKNI